MKEEDKENENKRKDSVTRLAEMHCCHILNYEGKHVLFLFYLFFMNLMSYRGFVTTSAKNLKEVYNHSL